MTPTQRELVTELIVAELAGITAASLAAGADPAEVVAELDRRIRSIREKGAR
jgi:hypothetical protein